MLLLKCCTQIWIIQQWPQDWKMSVFIPIPKKGNAKECSDYSTIMLIPHAGQFMLKILQVRLQQYMNWDLPGVQAGFRKGRGTRSNCNILWMIEKAMGSPSKKKTPSTSASLTTLKPLTVWITTKCGKFLKRWEYQTTCLLRNLYAGQEATVRTEHRPLGRGSALPRLGAELELRRSGSSLGPSQ